MTWSYIYIFFFIFYSIMVCWWNVSHLFHHGLLTDYWLQSSVLCSSALSCIHRIYQWCPSFLVPGTRFMEGHYSTDWAGRAGGGAAQCQMFQVYYIYYPAADLTRGGIQAIKQLQMQTELCSLCRHSPPAAWPGSWPATDQHRPGPRGWGCSGPLLDLRAGIC